MIDETNPVERFEVVVAGAGPVGLSTALFLADRGVRVLVVDKRDPLSGPPRAGSSVRTLELFRALGLGEHLDRPLPSARPYALCTGTPEGVGLSSANPAAVVGLGRARHGQGGGDQPHFPDLGEAEDPHARAW